LRAISRVAAPCSSTAAALAVVASLLSPVVWPMCLMVPTADAQIASMQQVTARELPRWPARSGWH